MSIKPEPSLNSTKVLSGALSGGGVLRLSGRDAIAFAQAQFANDVAQLADGQWQWNLWLSAKGRVIALFALLRAGPEELIAWLPDFPAAELAERLTRFRFRSKLVIQALEGMHAGGAFAAPANLGWDAIGNRVTMERDEDGRVTRVALDMSGHAPRTLLLETAPPPAHQPSRDTDARWRHEDIAHGLPRLAGAQIEAFTPQMLGLDRLHAFSVKKGCYPGQEIVARTHFLGQAKRTVVRLALNIDAPPGLRLTSASGAQAELLCVARFDGHIQALAIAPIDTGNAPFGSEDGRIHASLLPLLDGLSRA